MRRGWKVGAEDFRDWLADKLARRGRKGERASERRETDAWRRTIDLNITGTMLTIKSSNALATASFVCEKTRSHSVDIVGIKSKLNAI